MTYLEAKQMADHLNGVLSMADVAIKARPGHLHPRATENAILEAAAKTWLSIYPDSPIKSIFGKSGLGG